MARKEWWHLFRDPRSLALILLMPTMLLFLFGYAIKLDIYGAPIGILQESRDAASNDLAARLEGSPAFRVVGYYNSRARLAEDLQAGAIWAGVVIPYDYARDLARGAAKVQLILDGVDANSARLVRNYVLSLVNDYALELTGEPAGNRAGDAVLRLDPRVWFNEASESRPAIVPGVIALVMAVIGALMTSLTIAREAEQGTLAMLRTTPLTRTEFLLGKLSPYFVIGMADLVIAVSTAVFIFDVPVRGSLAALGLLSGLFVLVVMLQGALISIVAANQILASQMALISTFLPAFLLSGFIFAIQNMPTVLQYITLAVPSRYYVALTRIIFLKGVSPLLLWSQVAALAVMALLLGLATLRKARKLGLLS
jgi:drug efflux transport system permease protein